MKQCMAASPLYVFSLTFILSAIQVTAQNVGIGVTNPQKGKLEIAGALGNHTTVLTIGSDGTGISLQRNWPTIGFNQYRDSSNVQRFIGAGHAGSIYLSAVDGSLVFLQFGQGAANAPITTVNAPLYISGDGLVNVTKQLHLASNVKLTSAGTGSANNLLPYAFGEINSNGTKSSGTNNFISYKTANTCKIEFPDPIYNAAFIITGYGEFGAVVSYRLVTDNIVEVFIFSNTGLVASSSFSFVVFRQ